MAATTVVFENRFNVPPDYAAKWLTDMRPDDGQRWFDFKAPVKVTRKGNEIHSEGPHPMGYAKGVVVIDTPTTWHATTEFSKSAGAKPSMLGGVTESVRAEGTGTLHRAEVSAEPLDLGTKLLFAIAGKSMMQKSINKGFAKMKDEMEASFKAGKPPTA